MIGGGEVQSEEPVGEEPVVSPEFNEEVRATPLGLALNSGSAGKGEGCSWPWFAAVSSHAAVSLRPHRKPFYKKMDVICVIGGGREGQEGAAQRPAKRRGISKASQVRKAMASELTIEELRAQLAER